MVFESVVVELINKYLGSFVENLDTSQLKIGIWGGDVVLNQLDLKETALDDLDLPVKIKAGHIGKLTLKIPWKNLYTEPVIATVDGLYALAVPNVGIKYNAEKEEKDRQDSKQKKLLSLEEAKKLEAEKDKPKEQKQDSFAEKFATQVIKNLQVEVRNIHIRYEDRYTNPKDPFSIGITLQELLFRTTDESWKPCIIKEAVSQIYKLVKLEALAVYWNSRTELYDGMEKSEILSSLKKSIQDDQNTGFEYLVKPISSVAHLKLNTKPEEQQFSIPKIFLTILFDDIAVGLSKTQYNDILEMLEGFERVNLMGVYKKYKPDVPFKGHIKQWWMYAYTSILEENVRRRRKMWSWNHIKEHRDYKNRYREAYIQKIENKKVAADIQKELDVCEGYLDVFNITVIRQQAEVEAVKRGAKRAEEKKSSGWFGGWFGGGAKKGAGKDKGEVENIQQQFYEQFNMEEKNKLYEAIGYQENEVDLTQPKEFVAIRLVTKLNNLSITLKDEKKREPSLLKLQLKNVFASVGQRPAAAAMKVEAKMDKMTVIGTQQGEFKPRLVTSQTETAQQVMSLLDLLFETNPLDGQCDTRVKVGARPLQIIYDAVTINQLADFFKPPQNIQLKQLSQAAMSKYEEIKVQSTAGLQYAIDLKKYTEISADFQPSYVIIPHGGIWTKKKDVSKLILDLGHLNVSSEKNQSDDNKFKKASLQDIMNKAYNKFNINLKNIQFLLAHPGEDWQALRKVMTSPAHILCPISINIALEKCMFDRDPRMPNMKVKGELPMLSMNLSDHRLQQVLSLVQSIPLPESAPVDSTQDMLSGPSILPTGSVLDTVPEAVLETGSSTNVPIKRTESQESVNLTDMELTFIIKEINLNVSKRVNKEDIPLIRLVVNDLGTEVKLRTYDTCAEAYLGGIYLQYLNVNDMHGEFVTRVSEHVRAINMVNTPGSHSHRLLNVSFLMAKPTAPDFATTYNKTEQLLTVEFSALEILLHQEAILDLMVFAQSLQMPDVSNISKVETVETAKPVKPVAKSKAFSKDPEVIDMLVKARLNTFSVVVCTDVKMITDIKIKGIEANVKIQERQTLVTAMLKGISVRDPSPTTFYPNILEIKGSEVLSLDLAIYNRNTEGPRYDDVSNVDMRVKTEIGKIRVIFLNKYITDLLAFLNNFQAAQDKIRVAGDAMAEYTQEAVQNMQETASRLSLQVTMHAPIIFMPQNSTSYNVLMVDLGHLQVGNKFEKATQRSSSGIPAILERMSVTLTDMKIIRAIVDASMYVVSEAEILQPTTLTVSLCRNLAANWYHLAPDMEIAGSLADIQLCLSHRDFIVMMTVLNENLTEGQDKAPAPAPVEPSQSHISKKNSSAPSSGVPSQSGITESASQSCVGHEVWCKLKFNFCINNIGASLYTGSKEMKKGVLVRDATGCLGSFELQRISLQGQMKSDDSMDTEVHLQNMIMDDRRPAKQGGITRMLERSKRLTESLGSKTPPNMIDVVFKQKAGDSIVDVHMYSLYVCVCLDFLLSLSDFFTKDLPTGPTQQASGSTTLAIQSSSSSQSDPKSTKSKVDQTVAEKPKGEMTIKVVIDKPEIILIENQAKEDTNALMLDMELLFRMCQRPDTMDMSADIKNLGIVSCKYNNRSSGSQILTPCDFSFYSKTPTGQGAHMDLSTSDLIINISPATIRTMSAIAASMSQKGDVENEEQSVPQDLWKVKKLIDCDYWFLKSVNTAPVDIGTNLDEPLEERGEQMILKVPMVVVKIEGGVGNRTVPLLITDMSFEAEVRDWTGKLYVESRLKIEVAYYNEKISVWEPLLEPVLDQGKSRKWELQVEVIQNDDFDLTLDDEEDTETVKLPPPKMNINVKSVDSLQLTMTKTCLESLTNLGKAFGDAYALVEPTQKSGEVLAPYIILNVTGEDLLLKLDNSFEMPDNASNQKVKLLTNENLVLKNREGPKLRRQASVIKATQNADEKKMIFQMAKYQSTKDPHATKEVTIKRAEKRLFHFPVKQGADLWAIVCDTKTYLGQKTISFRSSVQVHNHLLMPVDVYFRDPTNGPTPISAIMPDECYSLPLYTIYTPTGEFMFLPAKDGCIEFSEAVGWKGAENMGLKQLTCKSRAGLQPVYLKVRAEIEEVYYEGGDTMSAKVTVFHLHPTVVFHNLLPYNIKLMLEGTADTILLERGGHVPLDHACIGKTNIDVTIPDYLGLDWTGRRLLDVDIPELSIWSFEAYQAGKKITMDLGLHFKKREGSVKVSVYSPYWMINKTSQHLTYKAGDDDIVDHPYDYNDIIMFAFRKNSLFSGKRLEGSVETSSKSGKTKEDVKKEKVKEMKQTGRKASLKIAEGDWSDKFSLDVVGSSGTVQSKSKTRTWEIGVSIVLSSSGLTKIVSFTPYHMLVNTSPYTFMCKECAGDSDWIQVPSKSCVPYWPVQTGKDMKMQASVKGTELSTNHFLFNQAHTTLMRLDNEYGGINIECQETESAMVTTLTNYTVGMATVLIINHTDRCDIEYNQSGVNVIHIMDPETAGLYTWEDSLGKRDLIWTCGERKSMKNDLSQDGIGEFFYNSDTKVYWVSFLNGMQRVLLFTHDLALATIAQEAGELERLEQEITISIQEVGMSLINNYTLQEVAYLGITSSGIIWEEKKKRFKAFNVKNCIALETGYQKFEMEKLAGRSPPGKLSVEKMEVNFEDMMMVKPSRRMIRRSFQEGLWVQYKTSPHQVQFHAKINKLQLDNQVSGSVFPTVLSPIPPPKSVAAESVPKPFTEVSMMLRKHEHSNVSQMKYFKVLIQEMQVKVDQQFLNNILVLFAADQEVTSEQEKQFLEADIVFTENDLITTMGLSLASEQKMFYDYLHLSPIKVHLSFSLQGGSGGDGKPTQIRANVVNIFLQSVGVVLTDVQDVIFKLGFFERQHTFYNNNSLVYEMSVHYAGQAIKQMYVLVLGLDVLGNPFGLLRGMATGIEDLFYEPYQGAIQGPEEFAEGMMLGVKSLFGHAVGGAAGAVSRITGTLGKGIAALTLDDDYQKKRREAMNKRPANVGEGIARGGKGLVMGVFDGVTGIVRKPIEGAKKEGVEGFFKGVGKGLVGVVTRPTSGVIDFASSSFEGIKRIAENVGEIHRLRAPRRFYKDGIIRPYNKLEAEGCAILKETEKGRYNTSDDYIAHLVVTKDSKNVFLVTNKRVIFASRGEIFGQWNCEFTYIWAELKEKPKQSTKGLELVLKEKEKKFLFGSSSSKKEILIADKKMAEWLASKISDVWDALR